MKFKGYYKYVPGTQSFKAKDKNGNTVTISRQEDEGDIYAVLYEAAGLDGKVLDGNNVLTSKNIVALARVEVEKLIGTLNSRLLFNTESGKRSAGRNLSIGIRQMMERVSICVSAKKK